MAAPTIYRSSDASAPTLSGTAGDLVNLLDKCLVSGYGAKSAAGWTRMTAFAGNSTQRAVFRQAAGNQLYLDIDDRGASSPLAIDAKEAAVRAYESMTDVSTGTNAFPTTALVAANTANWRKSNSANAALRGWVMFADDRTFILGVLDGDSAGVYKVYYFGDIYSLKASDAWRTSITVRGTANTTSGTVGTLPVATTSAVLSSNTTGFYTARSYTAVAGAINTACMWVGAGIETSASIGNQQDGNVYLSRFIVGDGTVRGWLRGPYMCHTPVGLSDGDTFDGTGDFAGRSFIVLKGAGAAANTLAIETTAWDTSS